MTRSTIKTEYDHSDGQWTAWFKRQKHDPKAAHGFGPTERIAIINLLDEAEDKMPPDEPAPLNEREIAALRLLCYKHTPGYGWGAWVGSALESLAARGYVMGGPHYMPTIAGRVALKEVQETRA